MNSDTLRALKYESSFLFLVMRNLQLIKDPREHFAIFWKAKNPNGETRVVELQDCLQELVERVQDGHFLSRCATVELLPAPVSGPNVELDALLSTEQPTVGSTTPQKVPGTYWVVPGDLLEVALIACEMIGQQQENERQKKLQSAQALRRPEDSR